MSHKLDFAVAELERLRTARDDAQEVEKTFETRLRGTDAYISLEAAREERKNLDLQVADQEGLVREYAMEIFNLTKEKRPHPNVLIKLFKVFAPYDRKKIEEWARQHAPAVFKFDVKSFEKVAIELGAPVEQIEEPRATISSKLE